MISARHTLVDLALLVALVSGCFFLRLTVLTIRGEESRRATIAMEMTRSGDWLIPRQQGEPFLSRPPLGNWLIALPALVIGEYNLVAVRLHAVLAILATTLLIYGYACSFLSGLGAVGAAAAFASMPEIQQMGRLAESDAVFTFFLGGALLVWHWGASRSWPAFWTWASSCALAALATLTKGPQAAVSFFGAVGLFLLVTRQYRHLVSWPAFCGVAVYALLVGAWVVPCYWELGGRDTWRLLAGDSADRFVNLRALPLAVHLVQYPLEILGCTSPWSFLGVAFLSRSFRRSLGDMGAQALFLVIAVFVTILPCWVTPGGQTRYVMPIYPCVAVLAGCVLDRAAQRAPSAWLQAAFSGARRFIFVGYVAIAGLIAWLTWGASADALAQWKQPAWLALAFMAAGLAVAVLQWRCGPFCGPSCRLAGIVAVAGFMGLAYTGPVLNQLDARSNRPEPLVHDLRQRIPANVRLTSLGPVHHRFAYEFGRPIDLVPFDAPDLAARIPPGGYFCYDCWRQARRALPFPHEEIAVVIMDRQRLARPEVEVIVARRLGGSAVSDGLATRK